MARADVRLSTPCWLRLRRGGCGVSMRVGARMPRALTRRGCPSGARSAKRVPRRTPQPPRRRLPRSAAQGSQTGGRLFFAYFLLAKQKKVSRLPGRQPGSRPQPQHAFQTRTPRFRPAQPERFASHMNFDRPAPHSQKASTTKTIAINALPAGGSTHFHSENQSPTSNRLPYCTRLVCFNAFIITFAAGDNSLSDRVMIPNASIWQGIASGNTVTIPCAA